MVLLAGCAQTMEKDGVTIITYCLIGGVYMDDTKLSVKSAPKPLNRPGSGEQGSKR